MSPATLEVDTMDPKLLTEIQRQEAARADLPEEYEFPLFDGRRAIESQRKSGYKNTARAARKIINNAIEAGARNVRITFKRPAYLHYELHFVRFFKKPLACEIGNCADRSRR